MKKSKKEQDTTNKKKQHRANRLVNIAALEVTIVSLVLLFISTHLVRHYTTGIDGRMIYVLEGISRLEASHLMAYISYKTPRWIGVYHSPSSSMEKRLMMKHVGNGVEEALKFHVRYTIGQYFVFVWCLCLPHSSSGHLLSTLLGFVLGFGIESIILFARRGDGECKFVVASTASLVFAFFASVMFADGCHYIQVVWGSGLLFSEWGLGIASFSSALAVILFTHFYQLQRTVRKLYVERRISKHETKDKTAIHLIGSHLFRKVSSSSFSSSSVMGSMMLSEEQRVMLIEEMSRADSEKSFLVDDDDDGNINTSLQTTSLSRITEEDSDLSAEPTTPATPTTWSLLKMRLFSPTDLVVFSRIEYYLGIFLSLASLFIVIVNIGATYQVNIVRMNYHKVHETLYGKINEGPVCAYSEIGGRISTFPNKEDAVSSGYTIAHCGACGQCSSWHDLRLQYTTRTYLAKESFRCSKKSLIYGPKAVHQCLQEEPIGFTDSCATCWTEDIMCAKRNCAFIFVQSNMINTVSHFQVGPETITSATCEEAMCELAFVPCSGANRRRMNITSMIARPGDQRCGIVDVDWEEIFGEGGRSSNSVHDTVGKGESSDEL
jgi:hypothetical protein